MEPNPLEKLLQIGQKTDKPDEVQEAIRWVKQNRSLICNKFANVEKIPGVKYPESIFMAGPPGAGKTEFSIDLLSVAAAEHDKRYVRVDADEIRPLLSGYNGKNAELFNPPSSLAVEKILDHVHKHNQNVLVDSTLSKKGVAEKNIKRALSHKRRVAIMYIYQEPEKAWEFTKAREAVEGRHVSREAFMNAFVESRETANDLKKLFGNDVYLHIVVKDSFNRISMFKYNIDKIDGYLKKVYNKQDLENLLDA
jgi:predicted ABC-type ATPase